MNKQALNPAALIVRAAELADTDGFHTVTLTAIARSFGVQMPSLYGHVRDLAALRDGVTALCLSELADLAMENISGRSGRDALIGFAEAHREYARTHPGRWEALHRRAGAAAVGAPGAAKIARAADAILHGYPVPPADRVHAIRLIGSTINGFITLERTGNFAHSEPASEESWTEALDSLHFVLAHWTERSPTRETTAS